MNAKPDTEKKDNLERLWLNTVPNIRKTLARVGRAVLKDDTLDVKRTRTFGYLCGLIIETFRVEGQLTKLDELAARLTEIEKQGDITTN